MRVVLPPQVHGVAGFAMRTTCETACQIEVPAGAPSMIVTLEADNQNALAASRLELCSPDGTVYGPRSGQGAAVSNVGNHAVTITVLNPIEGAWTARRIDAEPPQVPIQLLALTAPYDAPRDALAAASANVGSSTEPGIEVHATYAPFLIPVARALLPLAGVPAAPIVPVPVIAASDVLAVDPDRIADALSFQRKSATIVDILRMLVQEARLG